MESPAPSVSILAPTNDGDVDEAPHEPLDSRLVPISANKTLPVWRHKTDESMEIVAMLKLAACDIQQQHDANGFAITQKRARNE
jgi:hypothetical protein